MRKTPRDTLKIPQKFLQTSLSIKIDRLGLRASRSFSLFVGRPTLGEKNFQKLSRISAEREIPAAEWIFLVYSATFLETAQDRLAHHGFKS